MAKKKKKRVITDKELRVANCKHDKMYGKLSEQREWNKGVQQFDYIRHHEEQSGNGKLTGWSSRFQNVFPVSLGSLSYDVKASDVDYLRVQASFNYMYYEIVQISTS